jgi:hypothetical protein
MTSSLHDRLTQSPRRVSRLEAYSTSKASLPSLDTLNTFSSSYSTISLENRLLSSRSSLFSKSGRRRIAFSKDLSADKQLYIPRATEWEHGVAVQSVQTGKPMFIINHFSVVEATADREWQGENTEGILSEVDPTTQRVGKILAFVRREGRKYAIYTYFRAYPGQPLSVYDKDSFYQGYMFRYGEVQCNKKRCTFARASSLAEQGLDFHTTVLEAVPLPVLSRKEWELNLFDLQCKESQIYREPGMDAVTIRAGQNLLVATCLAYATERAMSGK